MVGSSQSHGERLDNFSVTKYAASLLPREGLVLVHASLTDDKVVDVPSAAAALLDGRAFAGINASANQAAVVGEILKCQKGGVAKTLLKINTACTAGETVCYVPADGGVVQPYSPLIAADAVAIGAFTQTKTASASEQMVGVELYAAGSAQTGERLLGFEATSPPQGLSSGTETAYTYKITIPANTLRTGSLLRIRAGVRIPTGVTADTLVVRVRLGGITGFQLLENTSFDPGSNNNVQLEGEVYVDDASNPASATIRIFGQDAAGAEGTAPFVIHGPFGYGGGAINVAVDNDLIVTADWSANTTDVAELHYFTATLLN